MALTAEQVKRYELPPGGVAKGKKGSKKRKAFIEQYGDRTWELEALEPAALQQELTNAIDAVIDHDAFNAELDAEKRDSAELEAYRRRALAALGDNGDDAARGANHE